MNKKLILATVSPYRQQAFEMLGFPFEAEGSQVEERYAGRPDDPEALVLHLAKLKAEAVAKNHQEDCTVIGFDSVGWFAGSVLEKPQSRAEMVERLRAMSGNSFQFFTGIHIIDQSLTGGQKQSAQAVRTDLVVRTLSEAEIKWYLDRDPKYKTYAVGFDPLGTYGSTFIKETHGSYNNSLRGIPLEVIVEMLFELGFEL